MTDICAIESFLPVVVFVQLGLLVAIFTCRAWLHRPLRGRVPARLYRAGS